MAPINHSGWGIFLLPESLWYQIQSHLQAQVPEEACGLISGVKNLDMPGWVARKIYPVENILHSQTQYRMDGRTQLAVFKQIEQANLELIAIFHSHPKGPESPSVTDIRDAHYPGVVHLICFLLENKWQCRGYQLLKNDFYEIELSIPR